MCAVRTGLASETRGIGAMSNRKIAFLDDGISINIGYWYLGCRNQEKIVLTDIVHLAFLIRKLTSSKALSFIDYNRRLNFLITCFLSFIQKEINQSALKLGSLAFVNRKTSSGNFCTQLKINNIVFRSKFPMRESFFA